MANTPRYSLDLYSFFNADPPVEESGTQGSIIPRPTPNVAAPVVEDPTKEVYSFMPTMAQLIEAEYPQGLSRATLPKDRFSLTKSVLEDYLNDLTPSGDDRLLLDEQGRPAESFRPTMRNAEQTAPVGDTETMRPTMAPERVAEEEAATEEPVVEEATREVGPTTQRLLDGETVFTSNTAESKAVIERLGSDFNAASRDDVRVLQKTLRDMAGPSNVDVGSIDGQWGIKGRNALWTFQLRAGLDPTGEMDEATAKALNNPSTLDPRDAEPIDVDALEDPAAKMLIAVEGLRMMPYELNSSRSGRSGLTFGAGIDVGQHTAESLKENFGFTDAMVEDFGVYHPETNPTGWIGRRPRGRPGTDLRNQDHAAMAQEYRRQREAGELPAVSENWVLENVKPVYNLYTGRAKRRYNELYGAGSWDELPEEAQAIPVLETYRGDPLNDLQLAQLRDGNYLAAARLARKRSRVPGLVKVLRPFGHES